MSWRMPGPWKHNKIGFYYLRQRMPADLKAYPPTGGVTFKIDGQHRSVAVRPTIKLA